MDIIDFSDVGATLINGRLWVDSKDLARALKYANPTQALKDYVEDMYADVIITQDDNGEWFSTNVIYEHGVYSLIVSSPLAVKKDYLSWMKLLHYLRT